MDDLSPPSVTDTELTTVATAEAALGQATEKGINTTNRRIAKTLLP